MSFTGMLGTADSRLGNIVLGIASSGADEPAPLQEVFTYHPPLYPILPTSFARLCSGLKLALSYPREVPPEADVAAAATNQWFPPYAHGPRRDGPFSDKLPKYQTPPVFFDNPAADPQVEPYSAPLPPIDIRAPLSPFPFAPQFNFQWPAADVPAPPPPGSPPPPPPPDSVIGPPRNLTPSIPRAPISQEVDKRVRDHIDKTATLLNDLERRGFIAKDGDGYKIIGGAFALFRAPGATDDETVGAVVGATFVDLSTNKVYICLNNTVASAVWREMVLV